MKENGINLPTPKMDAYVYTGMLHVCIHPPLPKQLQETALQINVYNCIK